MKLDSILVIALLLSNSCLALANKEVNNGGDPCEKRFQTIRDDLAAWIPTAGPDSLTLPSNLSGAQYREGMTKAIAAASVSCTDSKVRIGNADKVCVNSTNEGQAAITCDAERFGNLTQSDQYMLVHHEYAGIAGFELNSGEESKYPISNQLSAFLDSKVFKYLAIKPAPAAPLADLQKNFGDFLGNYEIVSCNALSGKGKTILCDGHVGAKIDIAPQPNDISVLEVVFEQDPNWESKPWASSITLASEKCAAGVQCATFYGKQISQGWEDMDRTGPYILNAQVSIHQNGGLTIIDWNNAFQSETNSNFDANYVSLVLRRK